MHVDIIQHDIYTVMLLLWYLKLIAMYPPITRLICVIKSGQAREEYEHFEIWPEAQILEKKINPSTPTKKQQQKQIKKFTILYTLCFIVVVIHVWEFVLWVGLHYVRKSPTRQMYGWLNGSVITFPLTGPPLLCADARSVCLQRRSLHPGLERYPKTPWQCQGQRPSQGRPFRTGLQVSVPSDRWVGWATCLI